MNAPFLRLGTTAMQVACFTIESGIPLSGVCMTSSITDRAFSSRESSVALSLAKAGSDIPAMHKSANIFFILVCGFSLTVDFDYLPYNRRPASHTSVEGCVRQQKLWGTCCRSRHCDASA